jgi:TolA-binding protein
MDEETKEVVNKTKSDFLNLIYKYKYAITVIFFIFLCILCSWGGGFFPRDSVVSEIITTTTESIAEEAKKQIKEKDKVIEDLQDKISDSQERVDDLNTIISKLRKEKDNVQTPKNIKEIKDMSNKLGYPTI